MDISLNSFASFANELHLNGMDQRAVVSNENSSKVAPGAKDCGLGSRNVVIRDGGDNTQANQNNDIRQQLLDAVMTNYGAKTFIELPKSVRNAFDNWLEDVK